MGDVTLSIAIGTCNDAPTVEAIVAESLDAAAACTPRHEVLVVDDGSTDGTRSLLDALLARAAPALRIVPHPTRQGYAATLRTALREARGDWILVLPGDGQLRADCLPPLWACRDRADLIVGRRVPRRDSWRRRLQSRVYNRLIRWRFGLPLSDVNSTRLCTRSVATAAWPLASSVFVFAELCVRAHRAGFRLLEVPVPNHPRRHPGAAGGRPGVIWAAFRDAWRGPAPSPPA